MLHQIPIRIASNDFPTQPLVDIKCEKVAGCWPRGAPPVKIDKGFVKIIRSYWIWLMPIVALPLAIEFLPDRIVASGLFFPTVSFALVLFLLVALWVDSRR